MVQRKLMISIWKQKWLGVRVYAPLFNLPKPYSWATIHSNVVESIELLLSSYKNFISAKSLQCGKIELIENFQTTRPWNIHFSTSQKSKTLHHQNDSNIEWNSLFQVDSGFKNKIIKSVRSQYMYRCCRAFNKLCCAKAGCLTFHRF